MTQDCVRRGEVEVEIRNHEMRDVVVTFHLAFVQFSQGENDLLVGSDIECIFVNGFEKCNCFFDPRLQLRKDRFFVRVLGRLDARDSCRTVLG